MQGAFRLTWSHVRISLQKKLQCIHQVALSEIPVNRIEAVTTRSKLPLSIDGDVWEFPQKWLHQVEGVGSQSSRHHQANAWKGFLDSLSKRTKSFSIHAETPSHAFVEKDSVKHVEFIVFPEATDDFIWVIASFFDSPPADLNDDFRSLTGGMNRCLNHPRRPYRGHSSKTIPSWSCRRRRFSSSKCRSPSLTGPSGFFRGSCVT